MQRAKKKGGKIMTKEERAVLKAKKVLGIGKESRGLCHVNLEYICKECGQTTEDSYYRDDECETVCEDCYTEWLATKMGIN